MCQNSLSLFCFYKTVSVLSFSFRARASRRFVCFWFQGFSTFLIDYGSVLLCGSLRRSPCRFVFALMSVALQHECNLLLMVMIVITVTMMTMRLLMMITSIAMTHLTVLEMLVMIVMARMLNTMMFRY